MARGQIKKKRDPFLNNFEEYFKLRLDAFKSEGHSEDWEKLQMEIFGEQLSQNQVTAKDIEYWNNLCKVIEEERKKGERVYWRNHYIDQIGLPETPKLVFVKGGKNIGKTYGIAVYLEKLLAENPTAQVVLVRTTKNEYDHGLAFQLMGEEWPFTLSTSTGKLKRKPGRLLERGLSQKPKGGRPPGKKLTEDAEHAEVLGESLKDKNVADLCGFATYASGSGFSAFQGSSYKHLKCVIWDELNDVGTLKPSDFQKFLIFLLSMERNNKDLKVWLYGNLLRREDGTAGDLALDFFKIPYDCKLKYFKTKSGTPCLYINTGQAGELFDGVNTQTYTDLFGLEKARDLTSNMPMAPSKVLNFNCFLKSDPYFSFAFSIVESYGIIYVALIPADNLNLDQAFYILHIENLSPHYHHVNYHPVSDSPNIVNLFNAVRWRPKMNVAMLVKRIEKMEKNRQLFFSSDQVRMQWSSMLSPKLKQYYSEELKKYIG